MVERLRDAETSRWYHLASSNEDVSRTAELVIADGYRRFTISHFRDLTLELTAWQHFRLGMACFRAERFEDALSDWEEVPKLARRYARKEICELENRFRSRSFPPQFAFLVTIATLAREPDVLPFAITMPPAFSMPLPEHMNVYITLLRYLRSHDETRDRTKFSARRM